MSVKASTYTLAGGYRVIRPDQEPILEEQSSLVRIAGALVQPVVDLSTRPLAEANFGGTVDVTPQDPVKLWLAGLEEMDKDRESIFLDPELVDLIENSKTERAGLESLLHKFGSAKGVLKELQSLHKTNAILKTREQRFKQDPLLRRRRLESCDHSLLRVLIVGLQNELLAARTLLDSWNLAKEPAFKPPRQPLPPSPGQPREMDIKELIQSSVDQGATTELSKTFPHEKQSVLISELQQENQELKRQVARQERTHKLMLLAMSQITSAPRSTDDVVDGSLRSMNQATSPTNQVPSSSSAQTFQDARGNVMRRPKEADLSTYSGEGGVGGGGGGGGEADELLKRVVAELAETQDTLRRREGVLHMQAAIERKQVESRQLLSLENQHLSRLVLQLLQYVDEQTAVKALFPNVGGRVLTDALGLQGNIQGGGRGCKHGDERKLPEWIRNTVVAKALKQHTSAEATTQTDDVYVISAQDSTTALPCTPNGGYFGVSEDVELAVYRGRNQDTIGEVSIEEGIDWGVDRLAEADGDNEWVMSASEAMNEESAIADAMTTSLASAGPSTASCATDVGGFLERLYTRQQGQMCPPGKWQQGLLNLFDAFGSGGNANETKEDSQSEVGLMDNTRKRRQRRRSSTSGQKNERTVSDDIGLHGALRCLKSMNVVGALLTEEEVVRAFADTVVNTEMLRLAEERGEEERGDEESGDEERREAARREVEQTPKRESEHGLEEGMRLRKQQILRGLEGYKMGFGQFTELIARCAFSAFVRTTSASAFIGIGGEGSECRSTVGRAASQRWPQRDESARLLSLLQHMQVADQQLQKTMARKALTARQRRRLQAGGATPPRGSSKGARASSAGGHQQHRRLTSKASGNVPVIGFLMESERNHEKFKVSEGRKSPVSGRVSATRDAGDTLYERKARVEPHVIRASGNATTAALLKQGQLLREQQQAQRHVFKEGHARGQRTGSRRSSSAIIACTPIHRVFNELPGNGTFIRQVFSWYAKSQCHSFGSSRGGGSFEQMAKEAEHLTQSMVMRMCRDFELVPFLVAKQDVVHVMVDGRRAITFGAFQAYLVELALRAKAQLALVLAGHLQRREEAVKALFAVAHKQWLREKTNGKGKRSANGSGSGTHGSSGGTHGSDSKGAGDGNAPGNVSPLGKRIGRSFFLKKLREDSGVEGAFDVPAEHLCTGKSSASKYSFSDFCASVGGVDTGNGNAAGAGSLGSLDATQHSEEGDDAEVAMLSDSAAGEENWLTLTLRDALTALNEQWADFLVLVREKRSEFTRADTGLSPQKGRGRHHLTDKDTQEDAAKCLESLLQYMMSKASMSTKVATNSDDGNGEKNNGRTSISPAVTRRTSLVFGAEGARSGDLSTNRIGMYTA
jgi:hypothetical protein